MLEPRSALSLSLATAGRTGEWGLGPSRCDPHSGFEIALRSTGMGLIALAPGFKSTNQRTTTSTDQRFLGPLEYFVHLFRRKDPARFCAVFSSLPSQASRTKIVYHISHRSPFIGHHSFRPSERQRGSKLQKSRLHSNPVCDDFALLGIRLGTYLRGIYELLCYWYTE